MNKKTILSIWLSGMLFLAFSSRAFAQTAPIGCHAGAQFFVSKAGTRVPITQFANGAFSIAGLTPGQYNITPNSAMLPTSSTLAVVGNNGIASGTISCAGYKYTYTAPPLPNCDIVSTGVSCVWYALYEPNYYTGKYQNSYHAGTNPSGYPTPVPRCMQKAPSTLPATTTLPGHVSPRCMRKYIFVRPAPSYELQISSGTAVELFLPD